MRHHRLRRAVAAVFVVGVATFLVGGVRRSDRLALVGILLALPQTLEAAVNLGAARRVGADEAERRRDLARRMLGARRGEELTLALPGGRTLDLEYRSAADLATHGAGDSGSVRFGGLLSAVKDTPGPLVLVGPPGAGKSLSGRRLVSSLLVEAVAGDGLLAERFSLWRWDPRRASLADWLAQDWSDRPGYDLALDEARRLIADPAVVLVLDGLDEMPDVRRRACVAGINAFIDLHPTARLVVCCREEEYRALDGHIQSCRVRRIVPLEASAIDDFITDHLPPSWTPVQAALAYDPDLRALLNKPLMLVAALRGLRDPRVLLEGSQRQRQHALWECYVDAMLRMGGAMPETLDDRRRWLEDVAITMAATGTYELFPEHAERRLSRAPERRRGPRRVRRRRADLRTFLDDCVTRHLLRRTADGYQCFHRQLLGHLVARASFPEDPDALRRRLLTPVPSEARAWHRLAAEALAAGHHEAAERLARRALALAPGQAAFLEHVAFHCLLTGRSEEAVTLAEQAEVADPQDWRPPSTLAYGLLARGDIEGSAAARRRAWDRGRQPTDGSLLAYLLDLLGRHDDALAMLEEVASVANDSERRRDRAFADWALVFSALGLGGDVARALFPRDATECNMAWALFTVPAAVAQGLVPGRAFEIVEQEPGVAKLGVIGVDIRGHLWGDFSEIELGLRVRPVGGATETEGTFVFRSSVDPGLGLEARRRNLSLPRPEAAVDVRYAPGTVTFVLSVAGQPALTLSVPRMPPLADPERIETLAYSYVGGVPYVTAVEIDMPRGVADPAEVQVEVGEGELADQLRCLGLPRAPDFCAWGEAMSGVFHFPRPLWSPSVLRRHVER